MPDKNLYDNPNNSRVVVEDPCVWNSSEIDDKFTNLTVTHDVSLYLNDLNEIVGFSETGSGGDIKFCDQNMYRDPTKPFTDDYYTKIYKPNGDIIIPKKPKYTEPNEEIIPERGGKRQLYIIPRRHYSRMKTRRILKKNRNKKNIRSRSKKNIRSRSKKNIRSRSKKI
jgi:hypothetical protein